MENLTIYNYHPVTGEFLSIGEADKDQLVPDNWLIPAYATDIKPPKKQKGKALLFKDGKWLHVKDERGKKYWLEDGTECEIKLLGETFPSGALDKKPDPKPSTKDEVLLNRSKEYASPKTGSDRYFMEAARKRAEGDEEGAKEAESKGLKRVAEIKEQHPIT